MRKSVEDALARWLASQGYMPKQCEFCRFRSTEWLCENERVEIARRKKGKAIAVSSGDYCNAFEGRDIYPEE